MVDFFVNLSPFNQALLATLFTWFTTALGAASVFFIKKVNKKVLDAMLGFAAGVMIAASFWSLLAPAISMTEAKGGIPWVPALVGFLTGGFFLWLADKLLPHLHIGLPIEKAEGIKTSWQRSVLLVFAVTLHNIPEGLAIGVAFGSMTAGLEGSSLGAAVALAFGIGLQNFPEGIAVSAPLRREGFSRKKAFFYGQASGIVEPIAGIVGVLAVTMMDALLPYALSFAAGAMIYVVVEELIPESQSSGDSDFSTIGAMLGFALMMLLDVAFS